MNEQQQTRGHEEPVDPEPNQENKENHDQHYQKTRNRNNLKNFFKQIFVAKSKSEPLKRKFKQLDSWKNRNKEPETPPVKESPPVEEQLSNPISPMRNSHNGSGHSSSSCCATSSKRSAKSNPKSTIRERMHRPVQILNPFNHHHHRRNSKFSHNKNDLGSLAESTDNSSESNEDADVQAKKRLLDIQINALVQLTELDRDEIERNVARFLNPEEGKCALDKANFIRFYASLRKDPIDKITSFANFAFCNSLSNLF